MGSHDDSAKTDDPPEMAPAAATARGPATGSNSAANIDSESEAASAPSASTTIARGRGADANEGGASSASMVTPMKGGFSIDMSIESGRGVAAEREQQRWSTNELERRAHAILAQSNSLNPGQVRSWRVTRTRASIEIPMGVGASNSSRRELKERVLASVSRRLCARQHSIEASTTRCTTTTMTPTRRSP